MPFVPRFCVCKRPAKANAPSSRRIGCLIRIKIEGGGLGGYKGLFPPGRNRV